MKKLAEIDLADTADALESLNARLMKLTLAERVDVCARLRGVRKISEEMEEAIKTEVKKHLKGKPGIVKGELFKAMVRISDVNRLDQKSLKEGNPEVHAEYSKEVPQATVTFEVR